MDFYILFKIVSTLSFSLLFNVNLDFRQDFFFFEGNSSTAHLYRENSTLFLYLQNKENHFIYNGEISGEELEFSWQGFLVNGVGMNSTHTKSINGLDFDTYTFLSPILNEIDKQDLNPQEAKKDSKEKRIKYWHIVLIFAIISVFFELNLWLFITKRGSQGVDYEYALESMDDEPDSRISVV